MNTFFYKPYIGKENLSLCLYSSNDNLVWKMNYPSFVANAVSGEMEEDPTLIELGVMSSVNDIEGLSNHLKKSGVIKPEDKIELKK